MKFLQDRKYRVMAGVSKYLFAIMIVFVFAMPMLAVNAFECSDGTTANTSDGCTANLKIETKIVNPLAKNIDSIPAFIVAILNIVLVIGVPIVALAIIYTGFLFVKAQGKPDEITKAKSALVYTLIGAALLLGSWVIANAIGTTVADISSTTK